MTFVEETAVVVVVVEEAVSEVNLLVDVCKVVVDGASAVTILNKQAEGKEEMKI